MILALYLFKKALQQITSLTEKSLRFIIASAGGIFQR